MPVVAIPHLKQDGRHVVHGDSGVDRDGEMDVGGVRMSMTATATVTGRKCLGHFSGTSVCHPATLNVVCFSK